MDRNPVGLRILGIELLLRPGPVRPRSRVVSRRVPDVAGNEREAPAHPEPQAEPGDPIQPGARPLDDGRRRDGGQPHHEPPAGFERLPELGVGASGYRPAERTDRAQRRAVRRPQSEPPLADGVDDRLRHVQGHIRRECRTV